MYQFPERNMLYSHLSGSEVTVIPSMSTFSKNITFQLKCEYIKKCYGIKSHYRIS